MLPHSLVNGVKRVNSSVCYSYNNGSSVWLNLHSFSRYTMWRICLFYCTTRCISPLCCECESFYLWKTSEHSAIAGLSTDIRSLRVHRFSKVHANYQFSSIDRSLSTHFFLLPEQNGRPVCLCTGLFSFISSSFLLPTCAAALLTHAHTHTQTLKHTQYSKKSCSFLRRTQIFCKLWLSSDKSH